MPEVMTRVNGDRFEVVLDDEVLHSSSDQGEAMALAQWASFQVHAGTDLGDLRRMLKGEQPEQATGYSGGLVLEYEDDEEEVPEYLELLDGRVTSLRKAIATGDYDDHLEEMLEAERDGKSRKSAVAALEERMTEIGGASLSAVDGTVSDLEDELAAGAHDDHLDELLEAEKANKDRTTAVAAIEARIDEIGGDELDLSVVDETVSDLKSEVEAGEHDDHLDELLEAEKDSKDRKTAKAAIADRMSEIGEGEVDLSIVEGRVTTLRKAVAAGDFDDHLDALLEAEKANKARKSAVAAIEERMDQIAD